MFRIALCSWILAGSLSVAADKSEVTISPCKAFSIKGGTVDLCWNGKPIPTPTITVIDFSKPTPVLQHSEYEVWFTPKGGLAVKLLPQWLAGAGANAIQLSDYLGTVVALGDGLPKAEAIVVTAESDPGPGEKGHKPIQRAADYKDDLIVPAGFYSVWIVPANGTKAQRIADRIRVQAGRETRVGE